MSSVMSLRKGNPFLLAFFLVPCLAPATGATNQTAPAKRDVVRGLLALRAPLPDWRSQARARHAGAPPADDAPISDLISYWGGYPLLFGVAWTNVRGVRPPGPRPIPTAKVRKRLLGACLKRPALLARFYPLLPRDDKTLEKFLAVVGDPVRLLDSKHRWKRRLGRRLLLRCQELTPRLAALASKARDRGADVANREYVVALAERSFPLARSVLESLLAKRGPRTKALAEALFYRHAIESGHPNSAEEWRQKLIAVVEDRKDPGRARDTAFEGLMDSDWPGRRAWYVSLFSDPTLTDLCDHDLSLETLAIPAEEHPDRWIPVIAPLVESKTATVRAAAITCLLEATAKHARPDALRPLLPWLTDPRWCPDLNQFDRARFVRRLGFVDLPAAVPGLIRYLQTARGPDRSAAARALSRSGGSRAAPSLRRALDQKSDEDTRMEILTALIACGGVRPREAARWIVTEARGDPDGSAARNRWTRAGAGIAADTEATPIFAGGILRGAAFATEPRARALIAWCRAHPKDRKTSRSVAGILAVWPTKSAARFAVRALADCMLPAWGIRALIEGREKVRTLAGKKLAKTLAVGGIPTGIAASLLGRSKNEVAILDGKDPHAKAALLAAARLVHEPLPLKRVTALLDAEPAELALAAASYLKGDDRLAARRAVWKRYPDQALILGSYGGYAHRYAAKEEALRKEVLAKNGPDEVLALKWWGNWAEGGSIVIREWNGHAQLFADGKSRKLSNREFHSLKNWLSQHRVAALAPLPLPVADGIDYEFLDVTRSGGWRVCMNNPGLGHPFTLPWEELVARMLELSEKGK